jgi:predicted RNase H-like HicB family nuclease
MSTKRTFAIILIPQENGTFAVQVPALPEVNSQGRTRAEAIERAGEAIALAIEQRQAAEMEQVTVEAA